MRMLFVLVLSITSIFANPVVITFINEVQTTPDSLQRIELHQTGGPSWTTDLSGWSIRTNAGIATINQGIILPEHGYLTIDSTNLSGTFGLNEITDTIILRDVQGFEFDRVYWPYQPASWRHAPTPPYNGSISLYRGYDVNRINWYIDSTPTFGMVNDNWSSISGRVLNLQGQPIVNHFVVASGPSGSSSGYTDSNGYYIVGGLGQGKYWLTVNYYMNPPVGNYPDSVYVSYSQNISNINITLPLSGIAQDKYFVVGDNLISVPNPFLNNSKISLNLPYENDVLTKLYDTKGSLIKTLINQKLNAGQYQIGLNTKIVPGIYFLNVDIGREKLTRKLILVY